jgi:hypothetical protein
MNLQQFNPTVTHQNEVATKLLKQHKEMTVPLLQRLTDFGESTCRRTLERLCSMGVCHQVRIAKRIVFRLGASPRQANRIEREYKPFGGIVWRPEINRPGCQDFLKYPSRIGDKLVPHRPMMHGCTPTGVTK